MADAISGDIIVSPFPGGYLIGRMRARTPPEDGMAWEYIRTEPDLQAAIKFARQVADRAHVGAWTCEGQVEFRKVPQGPPGR
jgi:hypothetical protein